jgi:CRP-like cAMP-binding protein
MLSVVDFALLADLTAEEQREVLMSARRRRYRAGEMLFHEGDAGESFHLIAKGTVLIRLSTPNGEVASVVVLVTGDGFGEQALLSEDSLRTASAQAVEPVETLTLSRVAFEELCSRYPKVQWVLMRQLAAQVRRLSQQVLDALYVPADRRVLRQALALGLVYADVVPFTQDDLASMAGTTRPTANRAMRSAAEAGCVELRRGGFRVTDRAEMERRAR